MGKVINFNVNNVPMTKEQANILFNRMCVLVGNQNVITIKKATTLFGGNAVEYARGHNEKVGTYCNIFGIGERGGVEYLNYSGYLRAVSYHNIELEFESGVDTIDSDTR